MSYVFLCLPIVFLIASIVYTVRTVKHGKKARHAIAIQLLAFFAVCVLSIAGTQITASAATTGTATATASQAASSDKGMIMIAAALSTGLACIGGGVAVAASVPAAIGATSEDPKAFGKAMIFVALAEGIAIYGLLVSILILNKA